MTKGIKHLYIHIPFCKSICDYCDFVRCIESNETHNKYINLLIKEILDLKQKFNTIYIGGGTPNCLSNKNLIKLFHSLQKNIIHNTEFTVECNPEFVNKKQANIFKKYKINRISLGAQTTNDKVLKLIGRKHKIDEIKKSIKIFQQEKINNISLDFIYGFNEINLSDIKNAITFAKKNKIKHVSFYSLEIKENSKLNQKKYSIDDEKIESELKFIEKEMKKSKFKRYEISNWAINKKYFSQHNIAYWKTNEWIGLGFGAFGLEKNIYYENKGNILDWKKEKRILSKEDLDFQILMMGLRLVDGINLHEEKNKKAFKRFEKKLNPKKYSIQKNKLKAKKINLLNDLLIDIV